MLDRRVRGLALDRTVCILAVLGLAVCALAGCATEFATVHVESNPTSAEVWVDGERRETTPCDLLFEEEGEFTIHVKLSGYETVQKLVRVAERTDDEGNDYLWIHPSDMTVTLHPLEDDGPAYGGSGSSDGPGYLDPSYE